MLVGFNRDLFAAMSSSKYSAELLGLELKNRLCGWERFSDVHVESPM